MRRRRSARRGGGEDGFGVSLLDLLTTALGCVLLIFIVYSVKSSGDIQRFLTANTDMIEVIRKRDGQIGSLKDELAQLRSRVEELLTKVKVTQADAQSQRKQRTAAFEDLLKSLGELGAKLDPRTARPVDVMLVIDGTNSMEPSLEAVRQNLRAIIGALQVLSPTARVGVTVFRDRREKSKIRLEYQSLSSNADTLKSFLDKIKAMSTRRDKDRPEWMCGGLRAAVLGPKWAEGKKLPRTRRGRSPWRDDAIKIVVIVSDAGSNSPKAQACIDVARMFKAEGGQVHVVSTLPRGYGKRRDVTREYDREVLRDHAAVAQAGGGEHIKRASESTLLEEVLRSAFRSRLAELERLKEIINEGEKLTE